MLYLLFLYTDYIPSAIHRHDVGWFNCLLVLIMLFINLSYILIGACRQTIKDVKDCKGTCSKKKTIEKKTE